MMITSKAKKLTDFERNSPLFLSDPPLWSFFYTVGSTGRILEVEELNQEQQNLDKSNIERIKPRTAKPRQEQYEKKD